MQSVAERDQSIGLVTHDLINKLSAIVGNCDLLLEATEQGTEHARRLNLILTPDPMSQVSARVDYSLYDLVFVDDSSIEKSRSPRKLAGTTR